MDPMDPLTDVIAAFTDGEPVDPDELKRALADADGREHLVDLLVLRGMIGAPPAPKPVHAGVTRPRASVARRWAALAALMTVAAAGGFAAGTRRAPAPPPVALVDNAAPAADTAASPAPVPTRVIHLKSGVDWREQQGGGD